MKISQWTTAQRNALTPTHSCIGYNLDTLVYEMFSNGSWQIIESLNNLAIVVKNVTDLPTPVAGVITLANNTTYQFKGLVNIGTNQLQIGISNTLFGLDKSDDGIVYTGTGAAIICTNQSFSVNNITVSANNGSIVSVTNTLAFSSQIRECILSGLTIGTISGGNLVAFNNNIIGNLGNLTFTSAINRLAIATNFFLGTTNLVRQVYLDSLTVGIVKIIDNDFTVNTGKIGIEANNVTITSTGQITSNGFSGDGEYLKGIANDNLLWELEANGSKIVPTSAGYNPNNIEVYRDDFIIGGNETGEIGSLGWNFNNGSVFLLNGVDGHCGIMRRTGTNDNQVSPFYLGTAAGFVPFQVKDLVSTIYLFRGIDLANQFTMQLGISTDFGVLTPTNGIYLRKTNAETTFFAVSRASSIETSVNTGITFVQNQWYKLEIINDTINNISIFKIDNVIVATITTNKPIGTTGVNIGGNVVRISAANRSIDLDFISFIIKTNTR